MTDRHTMTKEKSKFKDVYIRTYKNHRFFLRQPEESVIDIEDIAHALANQCRWSGHTSSFYSVAQHSVEMSRQVPPEFAFEALMHDAAEAYCVDLPSPLKWILPEYKAVQNKIEKHLSSVFNLPFPMSPEVKEADKRMMLTEWRDLFSKTSIGVWVSHDKLPPYDDVIKPWSPRKAEEEFLNAASVWLR